MFWMLCISVFESHLLSRAESKHRQLSACHRAAASVSRKHDHLRSHLELRTLIPAISSKTLRLSRLLFLNHRELNGGKNCHEAFVQAHSRFKWDAATAAVLSNLWKPKPSNLGSDAPYSECVWEGERGRDMSDTVNCCSSPQSLNLI